MQRSSTSTPFPSADSWIPSEATKCFFQPRGSLAKMPGNKAGTSRYPPVEAISLIRAETTESVVQEVKIDEITRSTIARIRELGTYSWGWNRPDSVPPASTTVSDAVKFARTLDLAFLHLPHISAADDGEINFWWDIDGLYIDLGFFGDGSYSFYAKLPNGKEIIEDETPVSRSLPRELLSSLQKTPRQPIYVYKSA